MSRISIDVTPQEHQKLKVMAALQNKTIKEFVLASILDTAIRDEVSTLRELKVLFNTRLHGAEKKDISPTP